MDAQQALQSARELVVWMGALIAGGALAKIGGNAADKDSQLFGQAWRALQGWFRQYEDAAGRLRKLEKRPSPRLRRATRPSRQDWNG